MATPGKEGKPMTEIDRLTSLGKKYLFAAGKLVGFAGTETELTDAIGNVSGFAKLIIDVAKVIATADRQAANPYEETELEHDLTWDVERFEELWDAEDSLITDLDSEEWLEGPIVGDILIMHESDEDILTGRWIKYRIVEVWLEDLHQSVREIGLAKWQHVHARFVRKQEGVTHD